MKPSDHLEQIRVSDIDLTDTRFQISTAPWDLSSLSLSIETMGLLTPPVVIKDRGRVVIVSGFRRIRAALANQNVPHIHCRVIESADDAAVRAVAENAFQRDLTLMETIRGLILLNGFMSVEDIAAQSLLIFNTRMNPSYIKDLLTLGGMGETLGQVLDSGHLSLKSAVKISRLEPAIRGYLLDLFGRIKASASKQREMITYMLEIMARDGISPEDFFGQEPVRAILNHDNGDLGFKADALRQFLVKTRFPSLEEKRSRVKGYINKLNLDKHIKLTLPENFEATTYAMSFNFKSVAEFKARLSEIEAAGNQPDFRLILDRK